MKKIVAFYLILFNCIGLVAQPNPGFENWTTEFAIENPSDWQTLNFLSLTTPPSELSAFKAFGTDAYAGNYSLKIKTIHVQNNPFPDLINDTFGCAFIGKFIISPGSLNEGFPYTARPEQLHFHAKYIPVGNDIAWAAALLKKKNTSTGAIDTIGVGVISIPATPSYSSFTINIGYPLNEYPDSAVIVFYSSKAATARVGSTLFVDEMQFSGWVGINETTEQNKTVKLFPNPASEFITIHTNLDAADHIQILDNLGMNVTNIQIDSKETIIPTSAFNSGTYYYHIRNQLQNTITTGKFTISK